MSRKSRKKRGGAPKKKTRKNKIRKIEDKAKNVVEKVPKESLKIGKKGVLLLEDVPKEALKLAKKGFVVGEKIWEKAEAPLEKGVKKGLQLLDKPLGMIEDVIEDVIEPMLPPSSPARRPFKVNIKKRTRDVRRAMMEIPGILTKIPNQVRSHMPNLSHIPGLKTVEEIPKKALGVGNRVFTSARRKTRKLFKPIKKILNKVEEIPKKIVETVTHPCGIVDDLVKGGPKDEFHLSLPKQPKICGVKPTTIIKDVGKNVKGIGHSMINGVKAGAKSITHLATGLLPTFTWPKDGKCPTKQKGGRRRRTRRHQKTHRHKTRRHKRRRHKTQKKRKRRRKRRRRRTRRH